jgi:hypothetical protein
MGAACAGAASVIAPARVDAKVKPRKVEQDFAKADAGVFLDCIRIPPEAGQQYGGPANHGVQFTGHSTKHLGICIFEVDLNIENIAV